MSWFSQSAMPAANCASTCCTMTIAARKIRGQAAQEGRQRRRPAGGGADRDQPSAAPERSGRDARRRAIARSRLSPTSRADHGDLGEQRRRGRRADRRPPSARRVDRVERAMAHRLEDARRRCASTLPVTIRIAQGVRAMIRRVASTPSIAGMIRSIEHQVGRRRAQSSTASAPSLRDPDDLVLGRQRRARGAALRPPSAGR